jgi:hypothetical protein
VVPHWAAESDGPGLDSGPCSFLMGQFKRISIDIVSRGFGTATVDSQAVQGHSCALDTVEKPLLAVTKSDVLCSLTASRNYAMYMDRTNRGTRGPITDVLEVSSLHRCRLLYCISWRDCWLVECSTSWCWVLLVRGLRLWTAIHLSSLRLQWKVSTS